MKHLCIVNKARFTISISIIFILVIMLFSAITSRVFSYQAPSFIEITVSNGDTLWSLAQGLEGNISENIYQIQKLNHLSGCDIYEGQILKIPENHSIYNENL